MNYQLTQFSILITKSPEKKQKKKTGKLTTLKITLTTMPQNYTKENQGKTHQFNNNLSNKGKEIRF